MSVKLYNNSIYLIHLLMYTSNRLNMPKTEYDKFWLNVQCTVDKDVVRTDRSHPYFAGNDNPNVEILRYTGYMP